MSIVSLVGKHPAVWIFFMLLGLYFVTNAWDFGAIDGEIMYRTTERLATANSIQIDQVPGRGGVRGVDGKKFSKYGLGQPLVSVILYDAGGFAQQLFFPRGAVSNLHRFFVQSLDMLVTPAAAVFVYLFSRRLYSSKRVAIVLAVLFGVGTIAWPYSKLYFSEPLFGLCVLASAYCLYLVSVGGKSPEDAGIGERSPAVGWKRKTYLALGGLLFGYALLTRVSGVVMIPVMAAYFFYIIIMANGTWRLWRAGNGIAKRRLIRQPALDLAAYAIPFAVVVGILLWHNYARFGDVFNNGYGAEGFTTPLLEGLYGFLFSSGNSIFLYSPVIIMAPFTFRRFLSRCAPEALVFAGLIVVNILYYSPWHAWEGGFCWGPRFLVPMIPFFILMIGPALGNRRDAVLTLGFLLPLSIFVNVIGTWVDGDVYIGQIFGAGTNGKAGYLFVPWLSPVVGNLQLLLQGKHIMIASFQLARRGFSPELAAVAPWVAIFISLGAAAALAASFWKASMKGATHEVMVKEMAV
ncbi:MAG: hypothetical protein M1319_06340 [Chloroflexi bacterium]|nr:hypothetical protein [Chloroflexota bacterium]